MLFPPILHLYITPVKVNSPVLYSKLALTYKFWQNIHFLTFGSRENKKRPRLNRDVTLRGTTLLWFCLAAKPFLGLKSLSDVTVAPVVPTVSSTHCSQNELHRTSNYCLAPPGNSLQYPFRLLFLLERIYVYLNSLWMITYITLCVKHFCPCEVEYFIHL